MFPPLIPSHSQYNLRGLLLLAPADLTSVFRRAVIASPRALRDTGQSKPCGNEKLKDGLGNFSPREIKPFKTLDAPPAVR